jgi:CheY-like chemotaxis protein
VVQGIIKSSGGSLAVESEPDHGTIFKIYLPAAHAPRPAPAAPRLEQALPRGTETILLAEDETPLRKLTALTLERLGYTVYKAENGEEALKLAAEHGDVIDLLVTDVVMPGMSGRELADALHAQRPELRVLYLSGYTDDAVVRNGVRQAEVSFLQKPFRLNALAVKLRETLDQPKRPTRAHPPDDVRPPAES